MSAMLALEETEQEFDFGFIYEGPQPYNFEPVRTQDHSVLDYDRLNGLQQGVNLWVTENGDRVGNTNWCLCGNCVPMESVVHSVCCQELRPIARLLEELRPQSTEIRICIVDHPGFDGCCLNPYVLQLAYYNFREQHGPIDLRLNKQYRYVAYRQMTRWAHGIIGRHIRKPLPSCVVSTVRKAFPDEGGHYKGFEWPNLD